VALINKKSLVGFHMKFCYRTRFYVFALIFGVLFSLEAMAQSVDLTNNYNLGYLSLENYTPTRIGSFITGGSIAGAVGYDDNVFDLNQNKDGGRFFKTDVYAWINSDWKKNSLKLSAYGSKYYYPGRAGANEYYANIFGYGRIDLPADTQFEIIANYTYDEDDRGSDAFLNNPATTPGDQFFDVKTFFTKGFGDTALTARAGVRYGRHESAASNAGVNLNRDDKDYLLYDFRLRGSYNIDKKNNVYIEGGLNRWNFDDRLDRNGTERGSQGVHVAAGWLFNPSNTLSGEIAVGYRSQSFADSSFDTFSTVTLDAWATWAVTNKANLTVSADTWFEEDTVFGEAGELSRSVSLQADYRVHKRIRAFAIGYYLLEDKLGTSIEDNTITGTVGINYEIQSGLIATAQFQRKEFNSGSSSNFDYNINKVWIGLRISK
jgi:hypothetical protein